MFFVICVRSKLITSIFFLINFYFVFYNIIIKTQNTINSLLPIQIYKKNDKKNTTHSNDS